MLPTDQWLHLQSLLGILETKNWFWFQISHLLIMVTEFANVGECGYAYAIKHT